MRRIIIRSLFALVAVIALAGALVWPWPAPEIDWRTPVDQALAAGDCRTAVTIADAASGAGSAEATKMLRDLTEGGKCNGHNIDRANAYGAFISVFRPSAQSSASVYGLDDNDLGLLRHHYVSAAIFLCAAPHNGLHQIDNAALSDVVPESQGPIMAFHQLRRETCITLLESVAEQLVDSDDAPANEVAYNLLSSPPITRTSQAGYLYGRLMLKKAFVPRWMRNDPNSEALTNQFRDYAWSRLEKAAAADNVDAIRLVIALQHDGRFRARDDKEAYFWILRLRRLGIATDLAANEIEANLSAKDREDAKYREAEDRNGPILFR